MDADGAGLLRDVLLNPDDDTPRLIYSDWLDDHGESDRAEFIRLQIAINRREPAYAIDEQQNNGVIHGNSMCPDVRRAYSLLNSVAPMLTYYFTSQTWRVWRRGFVEAIRCNVYGFARSAIEIVKDNPVVSIRMTDAVRDGGALHIIWRPYLIDAPDKNALMEWHDEVAELAGLTVTWARPRSSIEFLTAEGAQVAADEAALRVARRHRDAKMGAAWMNW